MYRSSICSERYMDLFDSDFIIW